MIARIYFVDQELCGRRELDSNACENMMMNEGGGMFASMSNEYAIRGVRWMVLSNGCCCVGAGDFVWG